MVRAVHSPGKTSDGLGPLLIPDVDAFPARGEHVLRPVVVHRLEHGLEHTHTQTGMKNTHTKQAWKTRTPNRHEKHAHQTGMKNKHETNRGMKNRQRYEE